MLARPSCSLNASARMAAGQVNAPDALRASTWVLLSRHSGERALLLRCVGYGNHTAFEQLAVSVDSFDLKPFPDFVFSALKFLFFA